MPRRDYMLTATIIAAGAAVISFVMAFVSWWYNREISRGRPALTEVKVTGHRPAPDKLQIKFLYLFTNRGRETLTVRNVRLLHFDFQNKTTKRVGRSVVSNLLHPRSIFNYNSSMLLDVNPDVSDEELERRLPALTGRHAFVVCVTYRTQSLFSWKEKTDKYFLGYEGRGAVYQLTQEEYDTMESHIPRDFRSES
jgi:hypothetical protein